MQIHLPCHSKEIETILQDVNAMIISKEKAAAAIKAKAVLEQRVLEYVHEPTVEHVSFA